MARSSSLDHPAFRNGSTTIVRPTPGDAHALRHELDKAGALSRRSGRVVRTTASAKEVARALRKAARSRHRGGVPSRRRRAHHAESR